MPIGPSISIIEHGVFEPEVIALMGEAVDAACGELPVSDQSDDVRELIAMLIIAAAFRGEIDPNRLRTFALSELSSLSEMSPPAGRDGRPMRLNERQDRSVALDLRSPARLLRLHLRFRLYFRHEKSLLLKMKGPAFNAPAKAISPFRPVSHRRHHRPAAR
jgi:hypothetical protein